jgi:hypothetical protein
MSTDGLNKHGAIHEIAEWVRHNNPDAVLLEQEDKSGIRYSIHGLSSLGEPILKMILVAMRNADKR